MKPAPFEYHRAYSAEEASALLSSLGDEAKIIAGGQSLTPMMNFRLARPSALVDVNYVEGLDYLRRDGDMLRVGALTRHRTVETSTAEDVHDGFGLLPRAARWIGHYPIRTRGTVGGSLAHADATAEWCLLATLFDAEICVVSTRGSRRFAIDDWFQGYLVTASEPDEMVTEISFRRPRAYGAVTEFARRKGDFAIIAVALAYNLSGGRVGDLGVVIGGIGGQPLRVEAGPVADGRALDSALVAAVAEAADEAARAADADGYRRTLVRSLAKRAFAEAAADQTLQKA